MKYIALIIISFTLFCACTKVTPNATIQETSKDTIQISSIDTIEVQSSVEETEEPSLGRCRMSMDFFGLNKESSIEQFFRNLESHEAFQFETPLDSTLKVKSDSIRGKIFAVVSFCKIPCGMNIRAEMKDSVFYIQSIGLLTSQRGKDVHDAFYNGLVAYYGEPARKDVVNLSKGYAYYDWVDSEKKIKISTRYQKNKDWGWKIIFEE